MEEKIKFLVDTNIWLELLLEQEKSKEVEAFLNQCPTELLFISDFSLHSIGVILDKFDKFEVYQVFIEDLFIQNNVTQLHLKPHETLHLSKIINDHNLDFDDAYQLVISELNNVKIISYDKDFKKVDADTYTPKTALNLI